MPANRLLTDKKRQYIYYLFEFQTDDDKAFPIELNNDPFSPKAEYGKIKSKVVPIVSKYEVKDDKGTEYSVASARCNVVWKIAIAEEKRVVENQGVEKNEQQEQLSKMLAGMGIGK